MPSHPPLTIDQLDEVITRPSDAVLESLRRCRGDFMVLGAGGKMGFHLCRMLQRSLEELGRSDRITPVSRFSSDEARRSLERYGFHLVAADMSEADQLARVPEADNVFYMAGVKFGTANDPGLLERMNVMMPKLVADRFSDSRIVALSTGCVYSFASPESGGSTEEDEMEPPGAYAQSCLHRERAFIDGSRRHGTRAALVRLNYSIDLRYGVLVDIAQKVMAGEPIDLETGYVNVIWQGDAISQILQCLTHVASPPWIINITGTETLSVRELASRFGKRFGCEPQFQGAEAETCWLSNSVKAARLFGAPSIGVEQMMEWIASWLKQGGETLGKPTHFQNRDGNYG